MVIAIGYRDNVTSLTSELTGEFLMLTRRCVRYLASLCLPSKVSLLHVHELRRKQRNATSAVRPTNRYRSRLPTCHVDCVCIDYYYRCTVVIPMSIKKLRSVLNKQTLLCVCPCREYVSLEIWS